MGLPVSRGATVLEVEGRGLIRRARLRYPNADPRRYDLLEQRGLDRDVIDAIMDRVVPNTHWIETGSTNLREQTAMDS